MYRVKTLQKNLIYSSLLYTPFTYQRSPTSQFTAKIHVATLLNFDLRENEKIDYIGCSWMVPGTTDCRSRIICLKLTSLFAKIISMIKSHSIFAVNIGWVGHCILKQKHIYKQQYIYFVFFGTIEIFLKKIFVI